MLVISANQRKEEMSARPKSLDIPSSVKNGLDMPPSHSFRQRPTADEQGQARVARRIDRGVGDRVLMRWISVEVRPMASGAKPVDARLSVEPRIPSRRKKAR